MGTRTKQWFNFSAQGGTALRCAECGQLIDLQGPSLDHHPRICPACGVECVYLGAKGRIVQVVMKNAPPVLAEAIRLLQLPFDEAEYVELGVALEELADALCGQFDCTSPVGGNRCRPPSAAIK